MKLAKGSLSKKVKSCSESALKIKPLFNDCFFYMYFQFKYTCYKYRTKF